MRKKAERQGPKVGNGQHHICGRPITARFTQHNSMIMLWNMPPTLYICTIVGPKLHERARTHVIKYVHRMDEAIVMAVEEGEACVMWAR